MPLTRRQALKTLTAATFATTALGRIPAFAADAPAAPAAPATAPAPTGPFKLPPLPYAYDALEPSIDAATMHLHHDKHHQAYVNKLNEALASVISDYKFPSNVDDLIKNLDAVPESIRTAVRNNGGGHSNHSLFWQTLTPFNPSVTHPTPFTELIKAIIAEFGDMDKFKEAMTKAGAGVFGSGWAWLVLDGKKLAILSSPNQDSPLSIGKYPLFGIDVWEHAYYLKYHNLRADYLKAIWSVVNWNFISDRYDAAMKA